MDGSHALQPTPAAAEVEGPQDLPATNGAPGIETSQAMPAAHSSGADVTESAGRRSDGAAERLDEVARRLEAIEMALERVGNGTYGSCESCGSELGEELLTAHPTARWCSRCAPEGSG